MEETLVGVHSDPGNKARSPAVSIGLAAYNDERYISCVFDDLLAQTFPDFELIVSDDASSDGTEGICRSYAERDPRIRYIRQPHNLGMQQNFEFVLRAAKGEFFTWASSDDRWAPDFLAVLVDQLRKDRSLLSAFCSFMFINEEDVPIKGKYSGIHTLDFSGSSALVRLARFCRELRDFRDAFLYGLHRREHIQDVKFPVWWCVNASIAANNNYPVLAYFLTRGAYTHVASPPLFYKRLHLTTGGKPRHSGKFVGHPIAGSFAFLLRKANVAVASVVSVHAASGSLVLAAATAPLFGLRAVVDCALHAAGGICRAIRRITRKVSTSRPA